MRSFCALLLIVLAAACGGDDGGGFDSADSDELACERFRVAVDEARTFTPAEMRERLQDIHGLVRVSDSPELAQLGQDMLAEFTNGTTEDFIEAVSAFSGECRALGV